MRVYDVAERDAPSAYLQALADGSDFVVGPLTREEVAALATLADGRATTLALNFLPDSVQVPDRFYQYALSPEDEARLAARRIAADGRTSGVTLAPQSDWGRRVAAAFVEEFTAAGGHVVDQAEYLPSTADFNEIIRRMLRTTGQRGSSPRPDAQFIFVAAQPVHGRLIRTQLRFNYASALPMYATSDVYDPAGTGNVDLDGVIFPDMPWVLDPLGASALARDSAERAFAGRGGQLVRLYAFGYDAYRLIHELPRLRNGSSGPLAGVSGRLAVDAQGRVRRELDWAQVVGGRISPWPPLSPGAAGHVSTAPHLVLGRAAEAAAARFLERRGYRILNTNFRAKGGEIDLVAQDGDALAIVEVRYRASDRYGGAAASITHAKRSRIIRAARVTARHEPADRRKLPARFDVVEVTGPADDLNCNLIRGAFSL